MRYCDMEKVGSKLLRHDDYVYFMCPGCKDYHAIKTGAGGWSFNGDGDKPTFTPSVLVSVQTWHPPVTNENMAVWDIEPWEQHLVIQTCHSFVADGRIQFLSDCSHDLKDTTVDLPDM